MKSFGAVLAFTHERNKALIDAFRKYAEESEYINLKEIGHKIVNSPAPRFWVSEERATMVVSRILRGKPVLDTMRPTKRQMFEEIYRRVVRLQMEKPDCPLCHLVCLVVNSPAPKFYMEASSALERLFKIRNGWYDISAAKERNVKFAPTSPNAAKKTLK